MRAARMAVSARTGGGYRERERDVAPGIRLTYHPPRLEWLWVVVLLLLGVAGMIAFVSWLGASAGVMVFDPRDVPFFGTIGAVVLAFLLVPIVRGLWPRGSQRIELDHVELRTASGDRLPIETVFDFETEEIPPPRGDALAPSTWRVMARARDGRAVVADALPTEDHARYVASRLLEVFDQVRRAGSPP